MRHTLVAGAVAAVTLLFMSAVPRPAEALPVSNQVGAPHSNVVLAGRGGHGGGHGGGHHGGGGHGGGFRFHGGGPHFGGGGRPHFRGGRGGHRHGGLRFRYYPGFYGYAPYYYDDYYFDDGYYDDSCAWLRRKAVRTNSRYWWRRYRRCMDSY